MEAKSALAYCQKKYLKSVNCLNIKKSKQIHDSFKLLDQEIKKLDTLTQIHLYSATMQLLDSLINEPNDSINPLDVFQIRCQSIFDTKFNASYHIVLGLSFIAIACAAFVTGGTLGIGIGILSGLWQTPLVYMASLVALELPAVGVAALSALLGIGVASGFSFFKEPKVVTAKNHCVDVIKESYIEEQLEEFTQEEPNHLIN